MDENINVEYVDEHEDKNESEIENENAGEIENENAGEIENENAGEIENENAGDDEDENVNENVDENAGDDEDENAGEIENENAGDAENENAGDAENENDGDDENENVNENVDENAGEIENENAGEIENENDGGAENEEENRHWKLDYKNYPKFQGGDAESELLDTWFNINDNMKDENFDLQRYFFSQEYNFHFNIRLRKEDDYLVATLRFLREVEEAKKTEIEEEKFEEEEVEESQNVVKCKPPIPAICLVLKVENRPHLIRLIYRNYNDDYLYNVDYNVSIAFPHRNFPYHPPPTMQKPLIEKRKEKLKPRLKKEKNDPTKMEIYVENSSMSSRIYSEDGVLKWAVTNYRTVKRYQTNEHEEGELSPYFYTDPRGYRVQVEVILNGKARKLKQDVCFRINFLNGLYDDWLTGYYLHKTTVSVVKKNNQDERMSKSREMNLANRSVYTIRMGSYEDVEKLIKTDSLCYIVEIVGISTFKKKNNVVSSKSKRRAKKREAKEKEEGGDKKLLE